MYGNRIIFTLHLNVVLNFNPSKAQILSQKVKLPENFLTQAEPFVHLKCSNL